MESTYSPIIEQIKAILLPPQPNFTLIAIFSEPKQIIFQVQTKTIQGICPDCYTPSQRVHSHAERTLKDLPISGKPVLLRLRLRRFFCDRPDCVRKTFPERFPGIIEPYAHRTNRLLEMQRSVGFLSGGETGAQLTQSLALPVSADSLIRFVRTASLPSIEHAPTYLGIDDWAFKKGRSYGTLLVDLETHRPIDLLPNRDSRTVNQWLKDHPGVKIVTRDRSTSYAEAIREGAPEAIQVADRFHLVHNLVEVIEKVLTRRYSVLQTVFKETFCSSSEDETEAPSENTSAEEKGTRYEQQWQQIHTKHQMQYEVIHELRAEGLGIRAISRQLGIGRDKVRRYLQSEQVPMYQRRKTKTMLDPYRAYIEQRWRDGQRNGFQLWQEIQAMSYTQAFMLQWPARSVTCEQRCRDKLGRKRNERQS